ncbi:MAG: TetR/AcrR family transcriptional regulator [Chloroflexi bacterium]|nr:TetR/AcrR family transcriptional regulator [Chloroflexota bacterium]
MTDRGQATRARLIEATLTVVREVGYPHASTRAIAQAAGVAEGTIYRHFPDKMALFFAAVMESNAPIIEALEALPERAGQATVEGNLIDAAVQLASLQDQIMPLELAIAVDPELAMQRRRALAAAGGTLPVGPPQAIAIYLAAEQLLGRVSAEVDARETAVIILAALFGLAAGRAAAGATLEDAEVTSAVRLLVRGIQPA